MDDEPGLGRSGLAALLPAAGIVVVVLYLVLSNPAAEDLLSREEAGGRALLSGTPPSLAGRATPALAPPAVGTPLAVQRPFIKGLPPYASGSVQGRYVGPMNELPRIFLDRDGHPLLMARWSPGPPSLRLESYEAGVFTFAVDGFSPGEWLLIDETRVTRSVGGHALRTDEPRVTARLRGAGDAILIIDFRSGAPGVFGPTLQVLVSGSLGSKAYISVPYRHHGDLPRLSPRRRGVVEGTLAESPFALYLPTDLPPGTVPSWAAGTPRGNGVVWDFAVPADGGASSLVMVQQPTCEGPVELRDREAYNLGRETARVVDCFPAVVARPESIETRIVGGRAWEVARAGAEWVAAARVKDTYVLMTAADLSVLLRAAASVAVE